MLLMKIPLSHRSLVTANNEVLVSAMTYTHRVKNVLIHVLIFQTEYFDIYYFKENLGIDVYFQVKKVFQISRARMVKKLAWAKAC